MNRSTIIAAIGELADYGIVEGRHGAGTRIASNTWSLMLPGAPDWADYVSSGFFKANNDTIRRSRGRDKLARVSAAGGP